MITLREYKTSDVERLVKLGNNKNVAAYLVDTFPHPYTLEDAKWWVENGCKDGITKVIEFQGEFVGSVGATPNSKERRRSATVGYWLGESYWGLGIATKALQLLTEEVFATTNIVRIYAGVYGPNRASMRVLEKAGYTLEGVLEKAIIKNDSLYDEHIYARIKS